MSDAQEVALATIHRSKYCIPIDHPILDDHGVFYPKVLPHQLQFELTFAPVDNIVVYSDTIKAPNYKIKNLELEYQCISSEDLANQTSGLYQVGKGFQYENVILHKTFTILKPNDSVINEHINLQRRSMVGILCLFTETPTAGTRDSENFLSPNIKSINFNIDGMPNKLYSSGMEATDLWESIKKRFISKSIFPKDEKKFYTDNKFALWVDLRTEPENTIHGLGLEIASTRDCVKLKIKRKVDGSGNMNCHMFVVADAMMEIMDSQLKQIIY